MNQVIGAYAYEIHLRHQHRGNWRIKCASHALATGEEAQKGSLASLDVFMHHHVVDTAPLQPTFTVHSCLKLSSVQCQVALTGGDEETDIWS